MSNVKIIGDCHIDENVKLGQNITIHNNVNLLGNCTIDDNVTIMPNTIIEDCLIGSGTIIKNSYLEKSVIGKNCKIGPFTHIRPNSIIEDEVSLGNFVEIKNSTIKYKTKVNHLAYVGDAIVGENCNIGCGAIFVNYNGKIKNKITVGDNCFIGSNCNLIAPLNIANNTYICAGSTLTKNTLENDFVIARCHETIKPNKAKNYLK